MADFEDGVGVAAGEEIVAVGEFVERVSMAVDKSQFCASSLRVNSFLLHAHEIEGIALVRNILVRDRGLLEVNLSMRHPVEHMFSRLHIHLGEAVEIGYTLSLVAHLILVLLRRIHSVVVHEQNRLPALHEVQLVAIDGILGLLIITPHPEQLVNLVVIVVNHAEMAIAIQYREPILPFHVTLSEIHDVGCVQLCRSTPYQISVAVEYRRSEPWLCGAYCRLETFFGPDEPVPIAQLLGIVDFDLPLRRSQVRSLHRNH